MTLPAVLLILGVFALILLLSRVGLPLGLAVIAGGLLIDICAQAATAASLRAPLATAALHLLQGTMSLRMWLLVLNVALILEFGRFATEERNARELTAALGRWGGRHGRAWTLLALPAVMGLIPMPGGALLSAPVVERAAGGRSDESAAWQTAVNYWFRHVWEYWWPLYPGVVLTITIFGIELWRFVAVQIWFTPVAIAAGIYFLIRPHLKTEASGGVDTAGTRGRIWFLALPLAAIVASAVLIPLVAGRFAPWTDAKRGKEYLNLLAILIGAMGALLLVARHERLAGRTYRMRAVFERRTLQTLLTVAGVCIFQHMLKQSNVVGAAGSELSRWGIPPVGAVIVLPFLAGLVTGLAFGFAGTAFPIIVLLMHQPGSGLSPLATLTLSYTCAYVGMMLSPVHICLVVTKEYFQSSLSAVLRLILPCCLTLLGFGAAYYFVLSLLGL